MTNKEKFLKLVSGNDTEFVKQLENRIKNRAMLRESQKIALKVLMKLDELKWSQKYLAKIMEVSPQQVNKIVSGKENLTLETQIKLQNILDIPVLASYYDKQNKKIEKDIITFVKKEEYAVTEQQSNNNYDSGKVIKMIFAEKQQESYYQEGMK